MRRAGRSARLAGAVAAAVWCAALLPLTLPPSQYPRLHEDPIDDSWQLGLAMAHQQGLRWGSEVVFTYGPLGYLIGGYDPIPYLWTQAVIAGALAQLALLVALAIYLTVSRASWPFWLLAAALLVLPAAFELQLHDRCTLAGFLLLLAGVRSDLSTRFRLTLLGAVGIIFGFAGMVSSRALAVGGVLIVVAAVLILSAAGRRWLAVIAPIGYLVSGLALWLLTGQGLQDLPAFTRATVDIVAGFAGAESIGGVDTKLVLGAAPPIILAAGFGLAWLRGWEVWRGVLLLTSTMTYAFFKEGFVRSDQSHHHLYLAAIPILLLLPLVDLRLTERLAARGYRWVAVSTLAALLVSSQPVLAASPPTLDLDVNGAPGPVPAQLLLSPGELGQREADARAAIRRHYGLPEEVVNELRGGTVDIYPYEIAIVYGYQLRWDPRPVLAAYNAYTPYLDHIDALHFDGPQAPDYVLYEYRSIDGRYPAFDEPETWRRMLNSYSAQLIASGRYVLLRKRPQSPSSQEDLGSTCTTLGSPLRVPPAPGRKVFAALRVPSSTAGTLAGVAVKPSPLFVSFEYLDSGTQRSPDFRLVEAVAREGVYVSSYVGSNDDFVAVSSGSLYRPIRSLTVTTPVPRAFTGQVCASFFAQR